MRHLRTITALFTCLVFVLVACQKWKDPAPKNLGLTNPYCNDPDAINYNWGFPGRPDDSVCYYSADLYKGKYAYADSIYLSDNSFSYAGHIDTLLIYALTKTKIGVLGFCPNGDTMVFNVDKSLNATIDSSLALGQGYPFCSLSDTATGNMAPDITDTTHSRYNVNISVASDTGLNFHRGHAIKL